MDGDCCPFPIATVSCRCGYPKRQAAAGVVTASSPQCRWTRALYAYPQSEGDRAEHPATELSTGNSQDTVPRDPSSQVTLALRTTPLTRAFRARLQAALSKGNVAADDIDRWRQEGASLSDEGAVDLALR
jgi:hypothetical protein